MAYKVISVQIASKGWVVGCSVSAVSVLLAQKKKKSLQSCIVYKQNKLAYSYYEGLDGLMHYPLQKFEFAESFPL